MKKKLKYILLTLTGISLLLSSCNNSFSDDPEPESYSNLDKNTAYISVKIKSANSRTILPVIKTDSDFGSFQKFILTGTKNQNSAADSFSRTYVTSVDEESGETTNAYTKLKNDIIPLPLLSGTNPNENWSFTLTGYLGGTSDNDATIYQGTVGAQTTNAGTITNITFTLNRTSAYKYSDKGNIKFKLSFTDDTVKIVTACYEEIGIDGAGTKSESQDFAVTSKKAEVLYENLDSGSYKVYLTFFEIDREEKVQVGTMSEYAYVLPGLTSELLNPQTENGSEKTIDVNTVYTITYKNGESEFTNFDSSKTIPAKFSRQKKIILPTANEMDSSFTDTNLFLGWYKTSDFSGEKITEIEKNTIVESLELYGKFINVNEMPTVTGVTLKYDDENEASNLKVGHKLTATPCYDNNGTPVEFLGTIASWKWYYGSDDDWTEIESTESTEITTTDTVPATDDTAATSSIWIKPAYAQKKIKAVVVQKYTITDEDSDGIYEISENIVNDVIADGTEKPTVTESAVIKGTLSIDSDFKLYYISSTSTDRFVVRTETSLDASKIIIDDTNVKSQVYDAFHSSSKTNWTLKDLSLTPVIIFEEGAKAPSSSDYVNATLKVSGYDDVALSSTNGVFVSVKYKAPSKEEVLGLLWKSGDDGDKNVLEGIDKGKVAFKKNKITRSEEDFPIYYNGSTASSMENPQSVMGSKASGTSGVYNTPACYVAPSTITSGVGLKANATPDADSKGNLKGFIQKSDYTTVSNDDLNGYVGTRVKPSAIVLKESNLTTSMVGATQTYKIVNSSNEELTYTDFNWVLLFGEYQSNISKNQNLTHTLTQQDYRHAADDNTQKKFFITASRTYEYDGNLSVSNVKFNFTKGEMKDYEIKYTGPALHVDDSVSKSSTYFVWTSLPVDNTTNASIDDYTINNVGNVTDDGNLTIQISAPGYKYEDYTVTGIPMFAAAPEISSGGSGGGGSDNLFGLSTDTDNISIGYAMFKNVAETAASKKYEFTRVAVSDLSAYSTLNVTDVKDVYGDSASGKTTKASFDAIFAANNETGWHAVTAEEFTIPSADGKLSVRAKMFGYINEDTETTWYYDAGTNIWTYALAETDANTNWHMRSISADGLTAELYDPNDDGASSIMHIKSMPSEAVDLVYVSDEHQGVRGVKNFSISFEHTEIKLTSQKSGGVVTVEPVDSGFTILQWKIDGMTVSEFKTKAGMTTGINAQTGNSSSAKLDFTLSALKDGTYQITVYGTDSNGITYSSGASIVISK